MTGGPDGVFALVRTRGSGTSTWRVCWESKTDQAQSVGVCAWKHSVVERQRKGMLRVSCPDAPVVEWDAPQDQHSAFLWRSDTVSFGAVKRNGGGKDVL